MPTVPNLKNSDIRQVVRTYRSASSGRLDTRGADKLKEAVLDGGKITDSERKDVQALLDADLFEPEARARAAAFLGVPLAPPAPTAPPGPSASKLVSTAVRTMKEVYAQATDGTRDSFAHPLALGAARATTDAFLAVDPKSAEGQRLSKAFVLLCERSMYPVQPDQPHATFGAAVVDLPSEPTRTKHQWGAATARWVYDGLRAQGRGDLLPPGARKFFEAVR